MMPQTARRWTARADRAYEANDLPTGAACALLSAYDGRPDRAAAAALRFIGPEYDHADEWAECARRCGPLALAYAWSAR